MNKKKGKLILIEGGEGCGKGEQSRRLLRHFKKKNIPALILREPGGTKEAELIRNILLSKENNLDSETELFLYEAARREIFQKKIKPALNAGKNIILDRSWPSTYAYQGYAGGINLSLIESLNYIATSGIFPDLLIIININSKTGLSKEKKPDRFALKGLKYHQKVNEGYLSIARKFPEFSIIIPYQEGRPKLMQKEIQREIKNYLKTNLRLDVKDNYQVFPVSRGIDFLGYRFFNGYTLVRKRIVSAMKRSLHKPKSKASYFGWLIHADSHRLINKYYDEIYAA